jgi:glyoxylase-like metal-dependent hydrolase (beta-lactamase superfamily II)
MATARISAQLTYWTAPHPAWRPNPEWPEEVGCAAYRGPDALALIDPLVRDDLDPERWCFLDDVVAEAQLPVVVLLAAPWHERSTRAVVERYAARVWAASRARDRVGDLPQLDELPRGVEVFAPAGVDQGQVAFYVTAERMLVVADLFLGTGEGLVVTPAPEPATFDLEAFLDSLEELARLPIDGVLVSHGRPLLSRGSEAISAALESFRSARQ